MPQWPCWVLSFSFFQILLTALEFGTHCWVLGSRWRVLASRPRQAHMRGTIQSHHPAWRHVEHRAQVSEARRAWPRSGDLGGRRWLGANALVMLTWGPGWRSPRLQSSWIPTAPFWGVESPLYERQFSLLEAPGKEGWSRGGQQLSPGPVGPLLSDGAQEAYFEDQSNQSTRLRPVHLLLPGFSEGALRLGEGMDRAVLSRLLSLAWCDHLGTHFSPQPSLCLSEGVITSLT